MNFLRISAQGGYITPDRLQQVAAIAKKYALSNIEIGFRQDLLIPSTNKQLIELRLRLEEQNFIVEEASATRPNVVSSLVSQNIFPQTSWLRSGDYLDILNSLDFAPRLKVNIIDPAQELIRPLTGQLNFIAASTNPQFWYLVINLAKNSFIWPYLVDGEQIRDWVWHIEQVWLGQLPVHFDTLFERVSALYKGRSRAIQKELKLTPKPYPHHEGIYRYDDRYWIGLYERGNFFEADFLVSLSQLCIDSKIGRIYPTPFKTLIIKDIPKETIFYWEKLLGKYGVHTHYSSLELNWQLPDADAAALALKTELTASFERMNIRTSSLSFSIGKPNEETTATVVIESLDTDYQRFKITHSPDFYIGNTHWETFAGDVARKNLPEMLRRLTLKYYDQLTTDKKTGLSRTKMATTKAATQTVWQCKQCLTALESIPNTSEGCPTCEASAHEFELVEMIMN